MEIREWLGKDNKLGLDIWEKNINMMVKLLKLGLIEYLVEIKS
ncbi:hypothetical protein [Fusobacterium mortiferum]